VSGLLQNRRGWRATPALLKHARKIIEVCGGEPEEVDRWTDYHGMVARYEITGEPLPTPPVASTLPTEPASDIALATADPTGDRPRRPRLRWAMSIATWAVVFGFLSGQLVYKLDLQLWQFLITAAFALLLPMALLTIGTFLMAFAGPRLDTVSRRHQERSFRANVPDTWPMYAVYLLVLGVIWSAVPLFDVSWLSIKIKFVITGFVVIALIRMVQLEVRKVSKVDTAWPPMITPDTLTFRRAATRLRQRLTTDQLVDDTLRRQAESVLDALSEVRAELTGRSRLTWRQWLTQGPTKDPLPPVGVGILASVVIFDGAGLAIRPWHDATAKSVLLALAVLVVATVLGAVALTVSFHTQRRHDRRLAEELREREEELRPLVFPNKAEDTATSTES